ncbi:NAD(P)-dependent dehydrogenase (short-subunit alcohol dehydrogenase family) [Dyadobacter jejuensis]|uniref:NAD(P)-dependent dehydrogenase (Short-subunit alcohol dehydrogenase family) n=1 Tax=Dyadobacter jejuensis TaxID=1082580 RepID=A0A316AKU6_9BACT|nr:glucose 1-dehydrogenase [Dyadobacter jejuensis]PWJ58393.1 NAD(P)-dependent dehydrogenase (short-subunit alcohol dehydrogenase family) [Dyadobacter jejuensis]
MFSLKGKVVIVTGGASGIGLAISQTFAKQGAFVHILELNEDLAQQVAADIIKNGGLAQAHVVNVADQAQVRKVVDAIATLGPINILVNNAGIAHIGKAHTTSEEDMDKIYQVNIKGVYNCLNVTLPHMIGAGGGVILNMASIAATVGLVDRFAYSAAKGAVYSMTLSVARDYLDQNIRCNSISPARVHTPFVDGFLKKNYPGKEAEMFEKLSKTQPIGRMAKPDEIGALALYLCSDEAGFVTGCDYLIDGGFEKLNT